ncbi:USP5 family protein [Megaselia abdita]
MEILEKHLKNIKIPSKFDNVYKDECVYCFDNPESSTGLYICLSTFLCFGEDYVEIYSLKSRNCVFLHLNREKKIKQHESISLDSQPEPKITKLALGIEGGFSTNDINKFEYKDVYNIIVFPAKVKFPYPDKNLPCLIQQSVEAIIKSESANEKLLKTQVTGTWDGEVRKTSKIAWDLEQITNNKLIAPSGWKCEKCDMTTNLWLNLTDGAILCGRKNFDGSGGNDHAVEHFHKTGYPLAVKLGTISADNNADVFSYIEDDMVIDPKLCEHLNHFGIKIQLMEKREKSMIELELDMNKRLGEWSTLTESESRLIPLSGPGYTGMINRGNFCYLNSVMQMLFIIPDFIEKYVTNSKQYFELFPKNPVNDFNIQMSKLGTGLWSGKYSSSSENGMESVGISPNMFKNLIGKNHPDFSTQNQQDALDFFLHLAYLMKKNIRKSEANPMDAMKFAIEDRVRCTASGRVKYTKREEYCLSLNIPMENAFYNDVQFELNQSSNKKVMRPRISLQTIIDNFSKTEIIDNYYSSAIKGITSAEKYSRFATLPDFLLVQFKKFTLRDDWVPIKLDVAIDNVEDLDLSHLKSVGKQPNEELLPEKDPSTPVLEINQNIVDLLLVMGFPLEAARKAVFFTKNSSVEEATEWIMQHITDSDINDPLELPEIAQLKSVKFIPDPENISILMSMGFDIKQATKALKETDNNIERATDWIFSHPGDSDMDCDDSLSDAEYSIRPEFRDGSSKYKLVAFISHMGSSSHAGHYVCHILKDDKWVIFNDNKVAISQNPPKDLGYLYMYKRIV